MNKYEENVYKNLFEYPTKKIVELELKNEQLEKENEQLKHNRDKAIGLIYDYQMNDRDNPNYKELLYFLKGDSDE